jgi:hypothetical protein
MQPCNTGISLAAADSVLERLQPFIEDTVDNLRRSTFREDPIAGRKYSRATSIMSSAYKRHGQILDRALLERLKDCARLRVWREDEFKLSHESLKQFRIHERIDKCLSIQFEYGERERAIPVDIIVFDEDIREIRSYNVKRGNGSYDGGKRRIIQTDLLRTNMLLLDYAKKAGVAANSAHANIIFYYGLLSIPRPLALSGKELDDHFRFPVRAAIEEVNAYFTARLHAIIEEGDAVGELPDE